MTTSTPTPATPPAVSTTAETPRTWTIGVLGGTGPQGQGLGRRFALAGHRVLLGSRDPQRATIAAARVNATGLAAEGASNQQVAARAEVVIVAVPYEGHSCLLEGLRDELAGKIVVDCVNPIGFDKKGAYSLNVPAGSAAEEARDVLPGSQVVAAFHHVSAVLLEDPEVDDVDIDVLVLGDDREATDTVQALAATISGMRGIYAGRLRNARQVEALTANLISINRRYTAHAGIRITDV